MIKASYVGGQPTDIGASNVFSLQNYERRYVFSQISEFSTVDSVDVFVSAGSSYRVGLYASPSTTDTDASTLISDFGIITNSGPSDAWISINAIGGPSIPAGTYPALFLKGENQLYVTNDWYGGDLPLADVIASRRTWLDDGSNVSSPFPTTAQADDNGDGPSRVMGLALHYTVSSPSAILNSPTPSGTVGSTTTATIGATTNQSSAGSNNVYAVVSTASLSGITAAQVKAGQNASGGTSGVIAGSNAVTSTSTSVAFSGLSAGTAYHFAVAQENANGLSNVLTGSFTTAIASRSTSITFRDGSNAVVASQSISWFITSTWAGPVLHSGTTSTDGSGALLLSGLSSAAGSYKLFYKLASNESHNGMSQVILV